MSTEQRRKCRLVNSNYKSTDLRQHSKIIIDTINNAVPNKNPKVFQDYFSTIVKLAQFVKRQSANPYIYSYKLKKEIWCDIMSLIISA